MLFELPPVFNRTNPINMSGRTGEQFAQAFINACMLPDEVSIEKRQKYTAFYKQLFDIAQDNKAHEEKKKIAAEIAENTLSSLKQQNNEEEKEPEISEIESLDLKDKKPSSSNNEVAPLGDEEDEIDYM